MIVNEYYVTIAIFSFILLLIFVCERFRFPLTRELIGLLKKKEYGDFFFAIIFAGVPVVGVLLVISGSPTLLLSDVILIKGLDKVNHVEYQSFHVYGSYKGHKIELMETYVDNQTEEKFALVPHHYLPFKPKTYWHDNQEKLEIIQPGTFVKLSMPPDYLFYAPDEISKKRWESGTKWVLQHHPY